MVRSWLELVPGPDPGLTLLAPPPHAWPTGRRVESNVGFLQGAVIQNSWISKAVCWNVFVPHLQDSMLPSCSAQWLFLWPKTPQTGQDRAGLSPKLTNVSSKLLGSPCWVPQGALPATTPSSLVLETPHSGHRVHLDELNESNNIIKTISNCLSPGGKKKHFRKIGHLVIHSFA